MTALTQYARLEASGLWRAGSDAQRREVVVSIGDASLIIADMNDRPLTHWSIAAVERHGSDLPAIYHPDGDPSETLELAEREHEMIAAIDKLRRAVAKTRPRPGRLRWLGGVASILALVIVSVFWLPGALVEHAIRVVPDVKRAEIGAALVDRIERVSGPRCQSPAGDIALSQFADRASVEDVYVVPGGQRQSVYLPGGIVIINRTLIEDYEEPDVAMGFILAETARSNEDSALRALLESGGVISAAGLLTRGEIPQSALDRYAEELLASSQIEISPQRLAATFARAEVRTTPYAYAIDISGETTLPLIEVDPMADKTPPAILPDALWLQLQEICES